MSTTIDKFTIKQFKETTLSDCKFLHRTGKPDFAESISVEGFNFKKFKSRAKSTGMHDFVKNDPQGVYATPIETNEDFESYLNSDEGYIIFKFDPNAVCIETDLPSYQAKERLMIELGAKSSKDLSSKLLRMGISAVINTNNGEEFITLDRDRISIEAAGVKNGAVFEVSRGLKKVFIQSNEINLAEDESSFGLS